MTGTASFDELFGPQRDYTYFAEAAAHPFPARAGGFDRARAWWLAEASLLAYVPEQARVREAWARAGVDDVAFLSRPPAHAHVVELDGVAVVVFRGTGHRDLDAYRADLRMLLAPFDAGRVHQGVLETYRGIRDELEERLRGRPCVFTGHSLGAALATLAASRHPEARALYTFGSPRVGDAAFAASLRVPAYRVVLNNDLITRLPPAPYEHVGELWYLDRAARLHHEPGLWDRVRDQVAGHHERAAEVARRWLAGEWNVLAWDSLVDHAPLAYARALRQVLAEA